MAHDLLDKPLKEGDHILIAMKIISISHGENYCNITAESLYPRLPDGQKDIFTGNSAVVFRANKGDHTHRDDVMAVKVERNGA